MGRIYLALGLANDQLHRIRCTGCGERKPQDEFSGRKLSQFRQQILSGYSTVLQDIRCLVCTSGHRQTLTCLICEETMELSKFSGAQRKLSDRAVRTPHQPWGECRAWCCLSIISGAKTVLITSKTLYQDGGSSGPPKMSMMIMMTRTRKRIAMLSTYQWVQAIVG